MGVSLIFNCHFFSYIQLSFLKCSKGFPQFFLKTILVPFFLLFLSQFFFFQTVFFHLKKLFFLQFQAFFHFQTVPSQFSLHSEAQGTHTVCINILTKELGVPSVSEQDAINVRYVCECVSRRAAHLVSAGAACLINKMEFEHVTVAVDGSVYR